MIKLFALICFFVFIHILLIYISNGCKSSHSFSHQAYVFDIIVIITRVVNDARDYPFCIKRKSYCFSTAECI